MDAHNQPRGSFGSRGSFYGYRQVPLPEQPLPPPRQSPRQPLLLEVPVTELNIGTAVVGFMVAAVVVMILCTAFYFAVECIHYFVGGLRPER